MSSTDRSIEKYSEVICRDNKDTKIFIAVSGGCDSMTLLTLFNKYHSNIEALHVNYKLRGIESDRDEQMVKDYCQSIKVPFHTFVIDLKKELENSGGNLQDKARQIRYDFFSSHLIKHKQATVALAHHHNDQIENFWMQMARGGGLRAMSGMNEKNKDTLRPFLSFSKRDIELYAKKHKIEWREDRSNTKNNYTRNIWRNVLLPELNESNKQIDDSVSLLQKVFHEQNLEDEQFCKEYLANKDSSFLIEPNEINNFTSNQWLTLLHLLSIPLSFAVPILKLFTSENGKQLKIANANNLYKKIWKEEFGLYFQAETNELNLLPELLIENIESLPRVFSKSELYIDPTKIDGELILRKWINGERIYPIGVKGSKLISDVLKDAKVPLRLKNDCWVIADDKKVLAVITHCIDRRALLSSGRIGIKISVAYNKPNL